jgi:hypothetical protein
MIGHYRKRDGQGKCEANRFLRIRTASTHDSGHCEAAGIDKAFVIQNLFQRRLESVLSSEIFLNYSLDSNLSPPRGAGLAELVDNHLQSFENKGKFLLERKLLQSRVHPWLVKKSRMCRQKNRAIKNTG